MPVDNFGLNGLDFRNFSGLPTSAIHEFQGADSLDLGRNGSSTTQPN